ncbi:MAG: polyamine ABC transporter ATP-binding protein, partial [Gammaproteobacteria bacterium]|nr:polyamine ABC transporter ATP-binding protein [Gammaproteobacteria bacterium]
MGDSSSALVSLRGLHKRYGTRTVLDALDLDIRDGEFLTLLGPSGCGKTTILRMLAGFEQPDAGQILLRGDDITQRPAHQRHINTVFQNYALFPHMSVFDNVAFGLRMAKVAEPDVRTRVAQALQTVQLESLAERKPHQLSGGQQQRVALARAFINAPALLLLDESLSALDYQLRKQMQVELKSLQRRLGITFVFVTHDQEEALSMSDRIVVLNGGRIEQIGTPREVYEAPRSLFVAGFVGESNLFSGTVLGPGDDPDHVQADLEGLHCTLAAPRPLRAGTRIHVLLRPEDLRVYSPQDPRPLDFVFRGTV